MTVVAGIFSYNPLNAAPDIPRQRQDTVKKGSPKSLDVELLMSSIIERIATGPELSKDISRAEARGGMAAVLDGRVADVQAALFLIALRMKRESTEESCGVFEALSACNVREEVAVDELLTIADPFSGFARGLPMSPFLPAVLAACGLPCLSTGIESVAPKFGLTHHGVLSAAGAPVDLRAGEGARLLADPTVGWAYLDQGVTNPKLFRLRELRRLLVKRTVLSTCEVALRPLSARHRDLLYVGYVHADYPPVYAMLAHLAGYDAAAIVKGVEGGVVPSLQAGAKMYRATGGAAGQPVSLKPASVGLHGAAARAIPAPSSDPSSNAAWAADQGLAALAGESGAARDSLVYGAAIAQYCAGRAESLEIGARAARRALDSGEAESRFRAAG